MQGEDDQGADWREVTVTTDRCGREEGNPSRLHALRSATFHAPQALGLRFLTMNDLHRTRSGKMEEIKLFIRQYLAPKVRWSRATTSGSTTTTRWGFRSLRGSDPPTWKI